MSDSPRRSLAFHSVVTAVLAFTSIGAVALLVFYIYPVLEIERDDGSWYISFPNHISPLFRAYLVCGTTAVLILFWRGWA